MIKTAFPLLMVMALAAVSSIAQSQLSFKVISALSAGPVGKGRLCMVSDTIICKDGNDSGIGIFNAVKPGRYSMIAGGPGFDTLAIDTRYLDSIPDTLIVLRLQPCIYNDSQVVVVQGRRNKTPTKALSVKQMKHDELINIPGTANDLNRVISINPGVLTYGTIAENSISVRGGKREENVYLIDGIEFDNINHFSTPTRTGGAIGFVKTDLIKELTLYTGGIPASMPSRTSSVIDVQLRDGLFDKYKGQADLDVSGFGLDLEGGFFKEKASFLSSVRWNDMRFLKDFITTGGIPQFGDGLIKLVFKQSDHHLLKVTGIASYDFLHTIPFWDPDPQSGIYEKELSQGGLGFSSLISKSRFTNNINLSFTAQDDRYFIDKKTAVDEFNASPGMFERFITSADKKSKLSLREDFSLRYNKLFNFDAGLVSHFNQYYCYHQDDYMDDDSTITGTQTGGYIQGLLKTDLVSVQAGLRADYYSLISDYSIAPRLGIAFTSLPYGTFTINGGVSHQLPVMLSQRLWYFLLPYHYSSSFYLNDFRLQRCWNSGFGYEKSIFKTTLLKTEIYFKWYDSEYPYWSPEIQYLAESIQFIEGKTLLRITTPEGKKKSYGIEISLKKSTFNSFFYNFGISLSSVMDQYSNGRWYNDKNDVQVASTIIVGNTFKKHHKISGRLFAFQGRPFNNNSSMEFENYYTERFDPQCLISVRYSTDFMINKARIEAYIEVMNILNQTAITYQDYDVSMGEFINQRMNGILPLCGIVIGF